MFKKLLTISLATCLGLSCFIGNITKAKALDNDIMNYVISGSGTEDDPYVLAGDNEYKEMFDEMAKEAVQPTVMPLVDFSGTLTGTSYSGQTRGGTWSYSGGGPTTSSNGALTILGISYSNNSDTGKLSSVMTNTTYKKYLVNSLASGLSSSALTSALTGTLGASLASAMGSVFGFSFVSFVASQTDLNIVNQALSKGVGILEISYRTSYNGSWFYTSCLDVWHTCPIAKTPGSYYGNGVYRSK